VSDGTAVAMAGDLRSAIAALGGELAAGRGRQSVPQGGAAGACPGCEDCVAPAALELMREADERCAPATSPASAPPGTGCGRCSSSRPVANPLIRSLLARPEGARMIPRL
jgi:hypothetical protein